jgi:hypothetical protein
LAHCPDHPQLQFCIVHLWTYIRSSIGDLLEFIINNLQTEVNVKRRESLVYSLSLHFPSLGSWLPFFCSSEIVDGAVYRMFAGEYLTKRGGEGGQKKTLYRNELYILNAGSWCTYNTPSTLEWNWIYSHSIKMGATAAQYLWWCLDQSLSYTSSYKSSLCFSNMETYIISPFPWVKMTIAAKMISPFPWVKMTIATKMIWLGGGNGGGGCF